MSDKSIAEQRNDKCPADQCEHYYDKFGTCVACGHTRKIALDSEKEWKP